MAKKTFGIIGAMKKEVDAISEALKNVTKETYSGIDFYRGTYGENDIVVAQCGVGKVFAAVCAQTMILKFAPQFIINAGVAGALSRELNIGDVAIAGNLVQYDMDTTAVGDPLGLVSGINIVYFEADKALNGEFVKITERKNFNYRIGTIATGDRFVSGDELKQQLVKNFGAIACEMEGASIAHVCYINKVPFAVLRTISDNGDGNDYMTCLDKACKVLHEVIIEYIKNA